MFARVLEAAPEAMVVVGHDGRIVFVNSQAARFFGRSRDDLITKPFGDLLPERFRGRALDALPSDLSWVRADGSELPVEIKVAREGEFSIVAIRDVSEQRRIQTQLMVSDRMATIGTLAAG